MVFIVRLYLNFSVEYNNNLFLCSGTFLRLMSCRAFRVHIRVVKFRNKSTVGGKEHSEVSQVQKVQSCSMFFLT